MMGKQNEASRHACNLLDELMEMTPDEIKVFVSNEQRLIRMLITRLGREVEL